MTAESTPPSPEKKSTFHALEADAALQKLEARPEGLSREDVEKRLAANGPNRLPEVAPEGLLKRFFKHFHDVLIYVLLGAATVTAFLGHWIDTAVIVGVVVINAIIGFIQTGKAEKALAGIREMLSIKAQVRRAGAWTEVASEELVPGDIVRLRSGNRVPADLRLIEVTNLRIEESALTGEAEPSEKSASAVPADTPIGDRKGMAYSGSLVSAGRGIGVVCATGPQTEIGRINRMISEVEKVETPLTRQMNAFGKVLSAVVVVMAFVMFGIGWAVHDMPFEELFLASIGFAVAAIPEGLPAVLTITLAIGVQRMAKRKAITRRLAAVETLGSVTVICSDKTGTLTRNEMTAREVVTTVRSYTVKGTGYAPEGGVSHGADETPADTESDADLHALVEAMAVCNDASVTEGDRSWKLNGEPTEGALVTLALKTRFSTEGYERRAVIPFESENKFMATLNRRPDGGQVLLMKGAPDRLLDRCGYQRAPDGGRQPLDRTFWESELERIGGRGERVLAAAFKPMPAEAEGLSMDDLDEELVFLGVVGIIDPPRPEAIDAIATCLAAGIRVKMITGDHALTARAIGREMGMPGTDEAVTGAQVEKASDAELQDLVRDHDVFARTSPEHKLRLVRALQANGEVVAMTGDGVNDAPALKRADVGVAMGIKGTEATKEAAEFVLADDNFASIERAVEEGRTIYDNLRKAILFILPTNGAEALVVLAAVIAGFTLPITAVQILWVNMVSAVTLALVLAFEPAEPGLMRRPPRDPRAPILGIYFIWRLAFISILIGGATIGLFLLEIGSGMPVEVARTVAVNALVVSQIFYLFNSRNLRESSFEIRRPLQNKAMLIAVPSLVLLQLLFVYAPFMHTWFGSTPLDLRHWWPPLAVGIGVFLVAELEKAIYRALHPLAPG